MNNIDQSSKEDPEKETPQKPAESLPSQEPVNDSLPKEGTEKSQSEKDSIKSRVARMTFTDAQMTEANFAMMDGLSEQQILTFFLPSIPAEEMERKRKQLMQQGSPKSESRSR